jgi:hypothetical protein
MNFVIIDEIICNIFFILDGMNRYKIEIKSTKLEIKSTKLEIKSTKLGIVMREINGPFIISQ